MSAEDRPRREVAHRLFAAEFEDTDYSYTESDEERAPNYVVTPSGARVNRLFVVGVLTEVEQVNDDFLRARVVDPTGAFVVSAGQYQPDALAFLERTEPPAFVAVTGKARTFEPDDGDRVYTSIRPESLNVVTAETRDRWVVTTAEQTLGRVEAFAAATARPERGEDLREALLADGVAEELAAGIPRAMRHYGTTARYLDALQTLALDAARVVAGDREEVRPLTAAPDEAGDTAFEDLNVDATPAADAATAAESAEDEGGATSTADPAGAPSTTEPVQPEPAADPEQSSDDPDRVGDPTDGVAAESADDALAETVPGGESDPATGADVEAVDAEDVEAVDAEDVEEALTDEEREAVHEEFDVSFSSGSDIPDAGESDIETPAPDEESDAADASGAVSGTDAGEDAADGSAVDASVSPAATDVGDSEADAGDSEADAGDSADLEDAVVDAMRSVGDGDGAHRSAVVDHVAEARGVDADAVEEAIQDALMAGRCYESGEDELTPI